MKKSHGMLLTIAALICIMAPVGCAITQFKVGHTTGVDYHVNTRESVLSSSVKIEWEF